MGEVRTRLTIVDNSTSKLDRIISRMEKLNRTTNNLSKVSKSVDTGMKKNTTSINNFRKAVSSANVATSGLVSRLRSLAGAYLGVMGARSLVETSDSLTNANNRLVNYGTSVGRMDISGAEAFSEETQNKIFAAAQSSFSNFNAMSASISKMLTSAGESFGDNFETQVDNAIVFQETLAKAFALGGATGSEISSVMTQMPQALASGTLQGDELRAIRENAPLAAKAIQDYANQVYGTSLSVKELGEQGMLTSQLVVNAMLQMSQETDKAFEYIEKNKTWSMIWTQFKNEATMAFKPVFEQLRELANSESFQFLVEKALNGIRMLSSALSGILTMVQNILDWVQKHWTTVQGIIIAGIWTIGALIATNLVTGVLDWISNLNAATLIIFIIVAVVALAIIAVNRLTEETGDFAKALGIVAVILGVIALIVGIIMAVVSFGVAAVVLIVIGAILFIVGMFFYATDVFMGVFEVLKAYQKNWATLFKKTCSAIASWWSALWYNISEEFKRSLTQHKNVFMAVIENIKIAFVNAILEMNAKGQDFIATFYRGMKGVADLINNTLGVFGISVDTSGLESAISTAEEKAKTLRGNKQDYVDINQVVADAWEGYERKDLTDAWLAGWNNGEEFINLFDAYDAGAAYGAELHQKINDAFNNLKEMLTVDVDDPETDDITSDLNDLKKILNNVDDNTGATAKSMELSSEDLKYLRQIAAMESINKFTTAKITVTMNNNNTVNNTSDLDGIATYLRDKLSEELWVVAEGVHA